MGIRRMAAGEFFDLTQFDEWLVSYPGDEFEAVFKAFLDICIK